MSSSDRVYVSRNFIFHKDKFSFADPKGASFGSLSPKSITPSKPFFKPCDSQFWIPITPAVSPQIPTSRDSAPFIALPFSPSMRVFLHMYFLLSLIMF